MIKAAIQKEGRLYTAWTPDLDIASQGKSPEEALANLKEAVELFLQDSDAELPATPVMFTALEVAHGAKASGPVGA